MKNHDHPKPTYTESKKVRIVKKDTFSYQNEERNVIHTVINNKNGCRTGS